MGLNKSKIAVFFIGFILAVLVVYFGAKLFVKPEKLYKTFIDKFQLDEGLADDVLNNPYIYSKISDETWFDEKTQQTGKLIYYINAKPDTLESKLLIFDLPGGAFISSKSSLSPYVRIKNFKYNVVSVEYPTLIKKNAKQMAEYIYNAYLYVTDRIQANQTQDFKVVLTAASAGVYFAVDLLNRKNITDKVVGACLICGYYGKDTMSKNKILSLADNIYIGSDTKRLIPSVFYNLVTTENDFLLDSSRYTAEKNNIKLNIYEGDHLFLYDFNSLSTKRFFADYDLYVNTMAAMVNKNEAMIKRRRKREQRRRDNEK